MKQFILFIFIGVCSSAFASDSMYKTSAGMLNINSLESHLSTYYDAEITEASLRWSFEPGAVISNILGTNYLGYIIYFKINGEHNVSCEFTLIEYEEKIMMNSCSSDTAKVTHIGFIPYEDVGLPVKAKFN